MTAAALRTSPSTPLWTRDQAVAATGGIAYGGDWRASGLTIDSRKVLHGDIFVALPGERADGHDYVKGALENGGAAALVSRRPEALATDAPLIEVPDVLAGLVGLATAARARSSARIAAVTGSVGKTGSKEMLAACLARLGRCEATRGNLNNHIGAPLSLARLAPDADFAVFELGMNHADEIRPLTRLVRPHVALITTVEPVHIEFFPSVEAIADAKAEILEGIEPGGAAVLNRDNPHFARLSDSAERLGIGRVVSFGADDQADLRLLSHETVEGGTLVTASVGGHRMSWTVGGVGAHWALNSCGVVATLFALGVDIAAALPGLAEVRAGRGRGAAVTLTTDGGRFTLLDESYNASPPAMRAALSVLSDTAPDGTGRRIAVLGDMRELGAAAEDAHAGLRDAVVTAGLDRVFLVGAEMTALRRVLPEGLVAAHGDRSEDVADAVAASVRPGDVVLVKGSLGTNMKPIVQALEALDRGEGSA
ncbi:MAG: UDP-N-acetylmuramoyl-tripeptide--D-alanyl-D-alanine ligase [Alphaproteobacteria bacterium]|nr:UDP-N-acetylmuramoyl-tripeptide--D-alanyl-D-alanine ligase [Alphaproteobacteria bacterium]